MEEVRVAEGEVPKVDLPSMLAEILRRCPSPYPISGSVLYAAHHMLERYMERTSGEPYTVKQLDSMGTQFLKQLQMDDPQLKAYNTVANAANTRLHGEVKHKLNERSLEILTDEDRCSLVHAAGPLVVSALSTHLLAPPTSLPEGLGTRTLAWGLTRAVSVDLHFVDCTTVSRAYMFRWMTTNRKRNVSVSGRISKFRIHTAAHFSCLVKRRLTVHILGNGIGFVEREVDTSPVDMAEAIALVFEYVGNAQMETICTSMTYTLRYLKQFEGDPVDVWDAGVMGTLASLIAIDNNMETPKLRPKSNTKRRNRMRKFGVAEWSSDATLSSDKAKPFEMLVCQALLAVSHDSCYHAAIDLLTQCFPWMVTQLT